MQPSEKIREYSKAVCGQIQWEKAHAVVSEEIENHLADQRDAYMADGADEAAATEKAIVQMGDPVAVGIQLDRTHRPRPQWGMLALAAVFICMGIALNIYFCWGTGHRWMLDLFLLQAFGLAAMAGAYFLGFTWTGRYPRLLFILLMAFFTAAFALREATNLWYYASFIMLLLPLGFAGLVYSLRNRGPIAILLCEAVFLAPVLLLFIIEEGWLRSQCVLYTAAALVTLCVAVSKGWFRVKKRSGYGLVFIPIAVTLLTALLIMSSNGRLERMWGTFHLPYKGDGSYGWEGYFNEIQAALAGSKFIGHGVMSDGSISGPGTGLMHMLTSLIFYTGWISVIPVFGLLLLFIVKGFRLCFRQKNVLGLLVSVSIMMTLTMQTICYVLLNFGLYLLSNISLPLIVQFSSWGYFVNMALVGLMLSVFRTGDAVRDRMIQKGRFIDAAGA